MCRPFDAAGRESVVKTDDTTTIPRKRGRPRVFTEAERAERNRAYLRAYWLEKRSKKSEALNAKRRERRAKRMSENPEAVLLAERERGHRRRAKRRIEKERTGGQSHEGK
jgi:hypothetical protein